MTEWEPATEAEVAMRNALRGADQELYFRILARTDLLLPVSSQALSRRAPMGWGTWNSGGRTHVLAFTSIDSMRICLAEHAGSARKIAYHDLANAWPNHEWWLAVNPGLPIEGYLPPWFVGQLARGDVRLPGRTSARSRGYDTAANGSQLDNLFTAPARPSASSTTTTRVPPTDRPRVPNGVPGPGRIRADQDQTISVTQAMADARRTATGRASPTGSGRTPTNGFTPAAPPPRPTPDEPIDAELVDIEPAASPPDMRSTGAVTPPAGGRPSGRGSRRRVFDNTIIDAEIIESTVLGAAALGPRVVNTTAIDASAIDSDVIDATVIESTVVDTGTHRIPPDLRVGGVDEQSDTTRRATRSRADRISGGIPRPDRTPTDSDRAGQAPASGTRADRAPAGDPLISRAPEGRPADRTTAGDPLTGRPPQGRPAGRAPAGGLRADRVPEDGRAGGTAGTGGPREDKGPRSTGFFDDGSRRSHRADDREAPPTGTRDATPAGTGTTPAGGPAWSGGAHADKDRSPAAGRPDRAHEAPAESLFTPASQHPGTTVPGDRDRAGTPGGERPEPAGTGRRHASDEQPAAPSAGAGTGDATGRAERDGADRRAGGHSRPGVWDDLITPGTTPASDATDETTAFATPGYGPSDTGTATGDADRFAATVPGGPAAFTTAGPARGTSGPPIPPYADRPSTPPRAEDTTAPRPGETTPPRADGSTAPRPGGTTSPRPDGSTAPRVSDPTAPPRTGEPGAAHDDVPRPVGDREPEAAHDGESVAAADGAPAAPATPGKASFTPANEVEAELLVAATAGQTDKFLSTLLLAKVLIPIPPGEPPDVRPDNPAFPWRREVVDGQPYLVVFTSPERMKEFMGEGVVTATAKFVQLIRYWPDVKWSFAVNPGSPVGATLPGIQVKALSAWADDVGLTDDDPEVSEYVEVPAPVSPHMPIIMQKPIAPSQVDYYLERGYDRASGFVHRATEVAHLQTPERMYATLGLSYSGSPFVREASEVFVLRWAAHRPDLYRIPYGGQHEAQMRAMQGWMIERPPFRGNGFAPAEDNEVIAEFKVDSIRLPHGAQMWRLTADGQKTQIAEFDADETRWRPVRGVSGDVAWDPTTPAVATVRSVEARSAASREADPLDPRWRGETAGV